MRKEVKPVKFKFPKKISSICQSYLKKLPPPTTRNLWLLLAAIMALQNLFVFTNSEITGNAITALIVWGGSLICMEDLIDTLRPRPSSWSLPLGICLILYTLYRTSQVLTSDSILYFLPPIAGLGLVLLVTPNLRSFKDSLIVLLFLPLFVVIQIIFARYVSADLSLLTAKLVVLWLSVLGIQPVLLKENTVFVNGGAVQVMHECNGFEMIMQMLITASIFLLAFPLRSRLGRFSIFILAPLIGFFTNSMRITLLAVFTSLNSHNGQLLFDFFHEQAGSLIFSGLSVFILGWLYLNFLDRELPPISPV